ncbi:hira-interacting protein 5 [Phaffia rhodozyma]|uniref:Hira-interacting protein 5 n=1 Tax=Phaffia rhodozyma TaxID=264483 RepID=A0A0F7SVC3_PHARH|nr:hira-interacting protein 5 [Phaffia rhodozyma]
MASTSRIAASALRATRPSAASWGKQAVRAPVRSSYVSSPYLTQQRSFIGLPRSTLSRSSVLKSTPSLSRSLFVQTQTTPNPNSLQFIPGTPVLSSGGTHEFLDTKSALASPLAIRLMGIEGVLSVFYGPDFVSVQKDEATPWSLIKPEVFSIIMEHFSSGLPLFKEGSKEAEDSEPEDTRILDSDSEVVAMIKELLATRIRPSIMEDGGDLEFMGFGEDTDGLVKIKLKGSCRGCSSSAVTLKSGVERMLMHYVPEVKGVEQVLGEEEQVALDEFEKFEARLAAKEVNW